MRDYDCLSGRVRSNHNHYCRECNRTWFIGLCLDDECGMASDEDATCQECGVEALIREIEDERAIDRLDFAGESES